MTLKELAELKGYEIRNNPLSKDESFELVISPFDFSESLSNI